MRQTTPRLVIDSIAANLPGHECGMRAYAFCTPFAQNDRRHYEYGYRYREILQ